jgi:hypothetical protein
MLIPLLDLDLQVFPHHIWVLRSHMGKLLVDGDGQDGDDVCVVFLLETSSDYLPITTPPLLEK